VHRPPSCLLRGSGDNPNPTPQPLDAEVDEVDESPQGEATAGPGSSALRTGTFSNEVDPEGRERTRRPGAGSRAARSCITVAYSWSGERTPRAACPPAAGFESGCSASDAFSDAFSDSCQARNAFACFFSVFVGPRPPLPPLPESHPYRGLGTQCGCDPHPGSRGRRRCAYWARQP
jgi:hypothetical protein